MASTQASAERWSGGLMAVPTEALLEVALDDGQRLAGTFVAPASQPPHPAVLLLNGSGPLDRDSNQPGQVLDIAKTLARAFGERGIASTRFDKRGVRESTGDYLSTGFDRETADAAAALAALRAHPEVDSGRVVVLGHSVGATIAMRLGAEAGLAGVVLLAGAAVRGDEVLRRQIASYQKQLREPTAPEVVTEVVDWVATVTHAESMRDGRSG